MDPRPLDRSFRVDNDSVDLARFGGHLRRLGTPFVSRLFTRREVDAATHHAVDVVAALGACLALKKAVARSIGDDTRIPLTDIEARWEFGAWNDVTLHGEAARAAERCGRSVADIATLRTGSMANASVIVRAERQRVA
ncbi:MAG: hypothetical protein MUF21_13015 [Gemmatimonadaceae bacterium]|jgi:phosphopantetheinyl transferase (holo-ACP synthase)|nr:hypothetical protein [Gemmatimonadaceae bacterium]